MGNPVVEKAEETNGCIDNKNSKQQTPEKANERPEWLPDGWHMEVKTRKSGAHMGSGYKIYIDPLNGCKFYSKPEVFRYLQTKKDNSSTSKKEKKCTSMQSPIDTVKDKSCVSKKEKKHTDMQSQTDTIKDNSCTSKEEKKCTDMQSQMDTIKDNSCTSKEEKCTNVQSPAAAIKDNSCTSKEEEKCTNMQSPNYVVIKKSTVEDLPPGWVKEVRMRKNNSGIRKDPFYIHPLSRYEFRSKKDVLRYVESGDIRSCAFKPSRSQIHKEEDLTPSPTAKGQKHKQSAPRQQLSPDTEILDKGSLGLRYADSSRKGQDVNVPSGVVVASVHTDESVVKIHSLDDGAANSSEIKKTSIPSSSALLKKESLKASGKVLAGDDVQVKEQNMMKDADMKNHSNHSISKTQEFNVHHRFSPRLAGTKPVQLANNVIDEQALQTPKRNLRKNRNTLNVDMKNKSSQHFNVVPENVHAHTTQQEVMNLSNDVSEDQAVFKERPHRQGTDLREENKSGIGTRSNKPSNKKKHHTPLRASKQLGGAEHELTNSISFEEAPIYESERPKGAVKAKLQRSDNRPVTVLAVCAPVNGEPVNKRKSSRIPSTTTKRKKIPKTPSTPDFQQEKFEDVEVDDEKSEPQLSFAFHYSWSDPNLESAINTLTGVLAPVKDSVDNSPTTAPKTDIGAPPVKDSADNRPTTIPADIEASPVKDSVDNSPTTAPKTDIGAPPVKDSADNRPATISADIEASPVKDSVDKRPTTVPKTDSKKTSHGTAAGTRRDCQNNLLDTIAGSRDKNSQASSNKPKRKKEINVPMRLSKRLAGLKPEVPPSERAVEYSTRKSCKEPTATATTVLTNELSDNLGALSDNLGALSDNLGAGKETMVTLEASDSFKPEVLGESSNKIEKSCDAQTVHEELFQKAKADNIGDGRSEPQHPLSFGDSWSDPCLEFAFKTLTGTFTSTFPVDAGADILPVMTPDVNVSPHKELPESVLTGINVNEEAHDNPNQFENKKEINLNSQPELRTSATSFENAPKFTSRESYVDQGNMIRNLHEEPQHISAGNIAQPGHSRNMNMLTDEESFKKEGQVVKGGFVTAEQQLLQTETINLNNSDELQLCDSFMNDWSDPCLDFAIKTLTGVIPVEENLAMQGCFQEPTNYHEQRDCVSTLPDFGSSSFSQHDISFHNDTSVRSMPGQQSSMSSSFLPLEKASLQDFGGVDPQKHYSQCNKNFQR